MNISQLKPNVLIANIITDLDPSTLDIYPHSEFAFLDIYEIFFTTERRFVS